jgi:muramoyltetrapeptide carboxypeptidase
MLEKTLELTKNIILFLATMLLVACSPTLIQDGGIKELDAGRVKIIAITPSNNVSEDIRSQLMESFPNVDFSECVYSTSANFCSCGKERLKKLQNLVRAFEKSASKDTVIWAVRGGYGAYCLIDLLLSHDFSGKQRVIIGYSDVTALLLYTSQKYGWKNIHGSMLREWLNKDKDTRNMQYVMDYLNGADIPTIDDIIPLNKRAETTNVIKATLTGGNMSLLESSIGTVWEVKADGKILLMEDCNETANRLYRNLVHMRQAGIFRGCVAIIFGEFTCPDDAEQILISTALRNFADEMAIPVYKSSKFGHGRINIPFVFNVLYKLERKADKFVLSMK